MDTKDFPVPNELIDVCAAYMWSRFGDSAEDKADFKHLLHQLIHDHNAQLAKMGFARQVKKSAWKKLDDSVESLKDFQAETVESVMGAAPEKMRNSIAYALTTLTVSLCLNKLEKIARSRSGAVAEAVDEFQHKIMLALDEFQRPFNVSDDGNIGL